MSHERRRQGRGEREREVRRPADAEGRAEEEHLERTEAARRQGAILRPTHEGVGVLLEPLVQGAGPRGDEGRPEDRVEE